MTMATLKMTVPDVLQMTPSLVLSLRDAFSGSNVLAGDLIVKIGQIKPVFQSGPGEFVFGNLVNGRYIVNVQSVSEQPYYCAVNIPVTLPGPRPANSLWDPLPVAGGYPDIGLADPAKMLDDPEQTSGYLGQRALATLLPTTAYPFPPGTTLVRGVVTAAGVPLSGALISTTPIAQPGQFPILVSNPSGITSAAQFLSVVNAPVIDSIDPPAVITAASNITLTVQGSGFKPGAVLKWNSTALPTTFLSSGGLAAQVNAAMVSAAGRVTLIAVNLDGTVSAPKTLTVTAAPVLGSIGPSSIAAGSSAFKISVSGSGFLPGAVVQLKSTALVTTWLSSTMLTAQVQPTQIAAPAQISVVVKNPGSPSKVSGVKTLAVLGAPVISSLEPATLVAGSPALTLAVIGSGFLTGAVVTLGAIALPTTYQSASGLTAQVTAGQVASAANLDVSVSNPDGSHSNAQTLMVATAPAISSLGPASVAAGTAAFSLFVRGSGFESGSIVECNGVAVSATFISSTELEVHVPRSGYTTGVDGAFVLFFDDIQGLSQTETLIVTHPSYPSSRSIDVTLLRGASVSASIDMSA